MAEDTEVRLGDVTDEGGKPNAETDERLSPEEHIKKLNHECAERRREAKEAKDDAATTKAALAAVKEELALVKAEASDGGTTKERLARLELGIKKSAIRTAVAQQVKAKREELEAAGKSVNDAALAKLLQSDSISIKVDYDSDVIMDGDDAIVRSAAQERIATTIGGLIDMVAMDTEVVSPNTVTGEGVQNRGDTSMSDLFKDGKNAWDEPSPLDKAGTGKKAIEAAMQDKDVGQLLGHLMSR